MRGPLALIYLSCDPGCQPFQSYVGTVSAIDYDVGRDAWPGWTMALKDVGLAEPLSGKKPWRVDHIWVRLHASPEYLGVRVGDRIRFRAKVVRYFGGGKVDFTLGHIKGLESLQGCRA